MAERRKRRHDRYVFEIRPAEPDTGEDFEIVQRNSVNGNSYAWSLTLAELFDLKDKLDAWSRERTRQAWERMRGDDSPE